MKVCNDGGIVNDERPMHPICLIHAGGPASKCAHRFQIQHLSELCCIRARIQDSRWPRDLTLESMDPMPARIVRFCFRINFVRARSGPEAQRLAIIRGWPRGHHKKGCQCGNPIPVNRAQAPVAPKQADGPCYQWPEGQRQQAS